MEKERKERKGVRGAIEKETLRRIKMVCAERDWLLAEFYEKAFEKCLEKIRRAKREDRYVEMREVPAAAEEWVFYMDPELAGELEEEVFVPRRTVFYLAIHEFLEELEKEE